MNAAWQPGSRVAGYVLGDILGMGGMGVVYRALEVETGRRVAIKTFEKAADRVLAERFRREGEAHAQLDQHPNVVRVYSAGNHAGRFYLVLELVEGEDLAARLRRGPLEVEEARRVVLEVSLAVCHAHAHGVLHRDLKPENVMLTQDGTAQLLDFGVSRLERRRTLTATGEILGTVAYMAPEQLNNSKEADDRADVYGLGAILFAALTGHAPFQAASQVPLMQKVLNESAPPPSAEVAGLPLWCDSICRRALSKSPERRFASAKEFVRALEERRAHAPRRAWLLTSVLGLGALVVLGAGGSLLLAPRYKSAPDEGREAWELRREELKRRGYAVGALRRLQQAQVEFREGDLEQDGSYDYGTLAELEQLAPLQEGYPMGGYRLESRPVKGQESHRFWGVALPPAESNLPYYYVGGTEDPTPSQGPPPLPGGAKLGE